MTPVWTYQGTFVDLNGGVYVMPQSANKQRNNAYYYNANGSTSPALPYPANVSSCQAWGAANGLNVIGLEYGGECYGCAGCNYAVDGAVSPNCSVSLGCAYNLQIYTLSAVASSTPPPLSPSPPPSPSTPPSPPPKPSPPPSPPTPPSLPSPLLTPPSPLLSPPPPSPPPSPSLAPVWTYQGTFVDLYGGVYLMPQPANTVRQSTNLVYFGTYNGSTAPAISGAASVLSCQAWGAANGLNVIGLEYGGQCFGCAGCNYAAYGKSATNCTVDIGCAYNLQINTLSAPQTRGLDLTNGSTTVAPASTAASSPASTAVSSTPRSLWIAVAIVGAATVAAAAVMGTRVYRRRCAARMGGDAFKNGQASHTKIPMTEVPSRLTGVDDV